MDRRVRLEGEDLFFSLSLSTSSRILPIPVGSIEATVGIPMDPIRPPRLPPQASILPDCSGFVPCRRPCRPAGFQSGLSSLIFSQAFQPDFQSGLSSLIFCQAFRPDFQSGFSVRPFGLIFCQAFKPDFQQGFSA